MKLIITDQCKTNQELIDFRNNNKNTYAEQLWIEKITKIDDLIDQISNTNLSTNKESFKIAA